MDWEPYMETATQNQATLQEYQQQLLKWAGGQRPENPLQAVGIEHLLLEVQRNPQNAYKLIAAILTQQVEFDKAAAAMLKDLDNRKTE